MSIWVWGWLGGYGRLKWQTEYVAIGNQTGHESKRYAWLHVDIVPTRQTIDMHQLWLHLKISKVCFDLWPYWPSSSRCLALQILRSYVCRSAKDLFGARPWDPTLWPFADAPSSSSHQNQALTWEVQKLVPWLSALPSAPPSKAPRMRCWWMTCH